MLNSFVNLFEYVFYAIIFWVVLKVTLFLMKLFKLRFFPESEYLCRATPSLQLVPRLWPFVSKNSTLYITGGSSEYGLRFIYGYFWLYALRKWLRFGMKIHYFLTDELEIKSIGGAYKKLCIDYPDQFYLYIENSKSKNIPTAIKNILSKYQTYHPTILVRENDEIIVWLEANHQQGKPAFGIEFLVPEDTKDDTRIHEILSDFKVMIKKITPYSASKKVSSFS